MYMIKYWFAICMSFFGIALSAQNNVVDEVIWVVGDEPILRSDVEEQILDMRMSGVSIEGDPYCTIPEQLAINKLFLHQASIDSVEVSDAEILQSVEKRMEEFLQRAGSREKLEEYTHRTVLQLRELFFKQFRERRTIESVQRKIFGKLKVTPAEVRNHFKDLPKDSFPMIPTKYEVMILSQTPVIPREEIDRVENELRDYAQRVNNGESDFSTLALLYSEDDASARQGGDIGLRGRGELTPEFANVAFSLNDPKKVSKIVRTEYGFHIIQFVERRGDKVRVRHILKHPRVSEEEKTASMVRMDSLANDIRRGRISFEDAVLYASDDKDTRNNHGLMVNRIMESDTRTPWFELQELPQEVAKVVSRMHIGEISEPFTMINQQGQEVCAIVKLKSKVDSHRASVSEDFQILQDVVVGEKQQEALDKWISEKQKTTYIRINEGWRDCQFKYPGWIK